MSPIKLSFDSLSALSLMVFFMGCSKNDTPQPFDCSTVTIVLTSTLTNPSPCKLSDGMIEAAATGGSGPYQFGIDSSPLSASSKFTGLAAGTYQIKVTDKNGCAQNKAVTLTVPPASLVATVSITNSSCKSSTGAISVTASGGTGPYQYSIGTDAFTTTPTFVGLAGSTYNITVKDNLGCQTSVIGKVLNGTSFTSDIKPIIDAKCAIPGCHNGDNGASRNWTVFGNLQANAATVKSRTTDKSMPKTGSLTQAQIDLIACWVDDGAPNN